MQTKKHPPNITGISVLYFLRAGVGCGFLRAMSRMWQLIKSRLIMNRAHSDLLLVK